ncbi:hypothetical protein [Patulibacter sp.]|uniref:hypothetical protein n=1 Tax=Patulibacter sp. TaxID=1912859 RepID=UPI002728928E|nr:hypothetical protein [Patulibacter sp.]MDO9407778.1 hypothetical protein [Patulibacter sp.]
MRPVRTAAAVVLVPLAASAALAPSAEATVSERNCAPGIQWTSAYGRIVIKQTFTLINRTKEDRIETVLTKKTSPVTLRTTKNITPGDKAGVDNLLMTFKSQYGLDAVASLDIPENVRHAVKVPAKRRVKYRTQIEFARFRGYIMVDKDNPITGPASVPVPGTGPYCDFQSIGRIEATAPLKRGNKRVVLPLKK